jgi:hypothetical protein
LGKLTSTGLLVVTIPAVAIPTVTVPSVRAPSVTLPSVTTPQITTPPVTAPTITIPPVTIPSLTTPTVTTPTVATPPAATSAAAKPAATTPTVTTPLAATSAAAKPAATGPTVTAPAAAKPATPASTALPQVAGSSRHANTSRAARGARGSRHAHRRAGAKRAIPIPVSSSRGAARLVAAGIPLASVHATTRIGRARSATHHGSPAPSRRTSPIVTTITRIVGVVPTIVWVLIGVLCTVALALAVRSRLSALRARRLERQRGELLEDVGLLQAALLPEPPARLGPVDTSVAYRPADGPGAGGDFYDVFTLEDGRLGIIVGDISGHGRQALPHTALVRFTLRAYLEAGLSPRAAVQTAGAALERQLGGSFATVVAATYQPRDRILTYACAGHPPPVVLGSAPSQPIAQVTVCSSPPIGAGMRTGTRQTVVFVPGRSQVCFHTDGLTEARVAGELFGAERLERALGEIGPGANASALLDRVASETDMRPDDMAACLLDIEGGAAAPAVLLEEIELDHDSAASDRTERFLLECRVERHGVAELMRSAALAAEKTGTVLLELRLGDGSPEVALQHDNVTLLHSPRARQRTDLRMSL